MVALERAWRESTEPHERTHATPYMYLHPECFKISSISTEEPDLSHLRWTVDTPEDLRMLRALYDAAGDQLLGMNWREILALVLRNENIGQINQNVRQKTLQEL
jgi:spore coat polysaccharide biosynthesis protein SpsF (cytidylyltransferase family)